MITRLNQELDEGAVCGILFTKSGPAAIVLNKKFVGIFKSCAVVNGRVVPDPNQILHSFGQYPDPSWSLPSPGAIRVAFDNLLIVDTRRLFTTFTCLDFYGTSKFVGKNCYQYYCLERTIGNYGSMLTVCFFVKLVPL